MFLQLWFLVENILSLLVSLPQALVTFVRDWLHFRELANRFPGPPTRPIVGNLFDCGLFPNPLTLIKWIIEDVMVRYPAGQIMMGPLRVFLLSEENDVQTFLMNSKNQSRPTLLDDALTYCLGRGLVTINGEEWSRHHKIITPSFHQNLLKTYVTMFDRKSDVFVEKLSEYANGSAFDVQIMTETLQLDIVIETLLGLPSNQQTTPDHDMLECISIGQKEISHRIRSPLLCIDAIYQLSSSGRKAKESLKWGRNFHNKVLKQRQAILRAKAESLMMKKSLKKDENTSEIPNIVPTDDPNVNSNKKEFNILIDALLQERGRSISHESVLDENLTLTLAGFDTTAIAIQFAFYFLAKNPHVQEKAVRELRDIFDAAGSTEVTAETLQRMQYVDMIVKETLRLHPPVFFYVKEAGVDTPLVSSNLVVPAGAIVLISPRTMHINPKLYPDPQVFDPERFSPENSAKRHPSAFIPFGAGMRACMGRKYAILVLKTVISKVIWNYRILPDETYEPNLHWGITMVTDNGMRIKLLKRSTSR